MAAASAAAPWTAARSAATAKPTPSRLAAGDASAPSSTGTRPRRASRVARRRSARVFGASRDNGDAPSWEELIERKVEADMKAAADVRDDMWGWEPTKERVLLVGVGGQKGDERADEYGMEASLAELAQLADTAGLEVVGTVTQRLRAPHPGTYVGKGKLAELRRACGLPSDATKVEASADEQQDPEDFFFDDDDVFDDDDARASSRDFSDFSVWDEAYELEREETLRLMSPVTQEHPVETVIFDSELTPRQARNLSRALDDRVAICDRTMLILDIFSQRARTAEGQLQVEMASLEYQLPRLTRMWTHLERQAGGAGGGAQVKGMGEKQIEIDKRLLRDRIVFLKKKLDKVSTHRDLYRGRRKEAPVPVVSLVGYTNAGKSSLLNALTDVHEQSGKAVLAEDKLFATLDPTTRRMRLPDGKTALATDTVGFIQRLPTNLVAAFRATLEEIKESSLLLHVVDVSSPLAEAQIKAVDAVLDELGTRDIPRLVVWNKCDALDEKIADDGFGFGDGDDDDDDGSSGSGGKKFSFPGAELGDDGSGDLVADDDDCEWEEDSDAEDEENEENEETAKSGGIVDEDGASIPAWIASAARKRGAVATSARTGAGVKSLAREIQRQLVRHSMVPVSVLLPYEEGKLLGEIRRVGVVDSETYGDAGVLVAAHVPPPTARRLRRFGHAEEALAANAPRTDEAAETNKNASEEVAWSAEEEAELARLMLEEEALEAETRQAT